VKELNLHIKDNTVSHRTSGYHVTKESAESQQLVVRRGQAFKMKITFNEVYDPAKYDLEFEFRIGNASNLTTVINCILKKQH